MSHQTGAESRRLSFQMRELTKKFRQAKAVQAMLRHVPTFHAVSELAINMVRAVKYIHYLESAVEGGHNKIQSI